MPVRLLLAALIGVNGVVCWGATASLSVFGQKWDVVEASDWRVDAPSGVETLELLRPREPLPGPRRPIQFAVARTPYFGRVEIRADVRPQQRSLMLVYAYRDAAHFNYAHLSIDTGTAQPFHNGIFHVFGGERVRISSQAGPAAFPATNRWYHVVLEFDGTSGSVSVSVNGHAIPALHAVDLSQTSGRIGLGSFDETGKFTHVRVMGESSRR